jgi:hypothetical protein
MSYFDAPPGERVLREFTIARDQNGRWLVTETPKLVVHAFESYTAAERFAVREAEGNCDLVHVLPPKTEQRPDGPDFST